MGYISRTLCLALSVPHGLAVHLGAQEPERVSGDVACVGCVITLDTVATIGGLDGPGVHVVTASSHVAVDGRGRILVADPRQGEISVFDATGRFLRTVGRRGEGPGEYGFISHISAGPRYIHVFEYHEGRTMLDHDFQVVRTDRFPGQVLSAAAMENDQVVFTANVPTSASVGHKLHILHPSGDMASYGHDGGVHSAELTRWTSQRATVTVRDDTVWAVHHMINRLVRWDLMPEPRVGRVFQRSVREFDEGRPADLSSNTAAMLDDRGLWIIWHAADSAWTEPVPLGGTITAAPRKVVDGWLDLVDPTTGRTLARHRQDGVYLGFAEGSDYVIAYRETDAGVPFLHVLEPRLSRR